MQQLELVSTSRRVPLLVMYTDEHRLVAGCSPLNTRRCPLESRVVPILVGSRLWVYETHKCVLLDTIALCSNALST